jgi:glucuronokinase
MRYRLSIPARINILGNPGDANEGDFATISAAVEMRAGALLEPAKGLVLESLQGPAESSDQRLSLPQLALPLDYTGELDLLKGAINGLFAFSPEFRQKFAPRAGVRIATWSDVPRQSGLGGSSLFILLVLAGLRQFYDLDRRTHNDYILAELTQRVEAKELGITCGFADRYVPLFGGLAYLDYRGKLHQRPIRQEPLVTYERLDAWAADLPLVAITTGIQHDSGDVHGRMRPRYVADWDAWSLHGGKPPHLVQLMNAAWETAWRGKIALLEGDLETFGALMNENHRLVNDMMASCGFSDGAGWANNLFIETARSSGALGAKLTGAGSGGSVFALTRPGEEQKLADAWQQAADRAGLTAAHIFRPQIARQGLVVEAMETKGVR